MKRATKEILYSGAIVLIFIAFIIGIRLAWAKFIYHDMRCAFAECRITVDPKD